MNEELDFQIGISGDGLDVSQTEQAVQNIQQADIEKGITASEEPQELPEEVTPEVVQEEKKEGPTAGDYVADTFVGLGEGARKAASNIITTPERVIDFFNGEMEKEMATEEGYQTEWDQFMYGDGDPITTKTWWGGFVSAATEVGTTIGLTGGFGKLGTGASLAANIKSGAIIGARYDLLAKNENQDNMTGMLVKKVPALDNALATNDADHPAMRKLKHVVEGMGIGMVFDAALFKLAPVFKTGLEAGQEVAKKGAKKAGQVATDVYNEREALGQALKEDLGPIGTELSAAGKEAKEIGELTAKELGKFKDEFMGASDDQLTDFGKKVRDIIISRRQSVEKQTREQAKAQMKDPGVRFPKNEPIGDRHLGNSTSNSSASDVNKSMKKVKQDWGSQDGHVGSMTSNTQIERMVAGTGEAEEVIKEILGNFRSQGFIKELEETARRQGKTLQESIGQDLDMFRAVYEGRNTENVNTREFFKLFTKDRTTLYSTTKSGKKVVVGEYVKPEYIKALDMVNTSLFNDIRDAGIGARELAEITDIKDIDGPAQQMFEK